MVQCLFNTNIKIVQISCIEFNLSAVQMGIRTSFKDDMGKYQLQDTKHFGENQSRTRERNYGKNASN